jgi:hypothetical protein
MGQAVAAAVSIGTSVAGAGASIYGNIQAQKAAAKNSKYSAGVAKRNALRAELAAKDAESRGKRDEARANRAAQRLKGRQRAVLAANGVDVGEGSALDIQEDTTRIGKADALTIRENARREAADYRAQGENFTDEYKINKKRASAGVDPFEVGATALTGVTQVASKWYQFQNEGVFG